MMSRRDFHRFLELLCAVVDRRFQLFAIELIVGALICVLEPPNDNVVTRMTLKSAVPAWTSSITALTRPCRLPADRFFRDRRNVRMIVMPRCSAVPSDAVRLILSRIAWCSVDTSRIERRVRISASRLRAPALAAFTTTPSRQTARRCSRVCAGFFLSSVQPTRRRCRMSFGKDDRKNQRPRKLFTRAFFGSHRAGAPS